MDETDQANLEMDRIQRIISRHEGHIFSLRGWLFAAIAGSLAAYFSGNVPFGPGRFLLAIGGLVVIFLLVELRHIVLIDALVKRVGDVEILITRSRANGAFTGWYDGPRVNTTCQQAMQLQNLLPRWRMTLKQNLVYHLGLLAFAIALVALLPSRQ